MRPGSLIQDGIDHTEQKEGYRTEYECLSHGVIDCVDEIKSCIARTGSVGGTIVYK